MKKWIYIALQAILVVAVVIAMMFMFTGCKTVQVKEQINYRDSIVYNYRDSIVYNYKDSVHIVEQHVVLQDSSHLIIQFGQGGGTYNAKTGEATNVAGVQQTDTHHEQRDSTAYYRSLSEDYKHVADSLSAQVTNLQSQYESVEKKARSGYARFTSWWFWITAILLLLKVACWVCEKIPATSIYAAAIRKFIPFL